MPEKPVLGPFPKHRLTPRLIIESPSLPNDPSQPSIPSMHPTELLTPDSSTQSSSVISLTSSTLCGIFSPTSVDIPRDESALWGTEAYSIRRPQINSEPTKTSLLEQPAKARITLRRPYRIRDLVLSSTLKSALLFGFGVVYGAIISHLHENHWITPVKMEVIDRDSPRYLGLWGIGGVALGSVLPFLDALWEHSPRHDHARKTSIRSIDTDQDEDAGSSSRWGMAVRSIGAFVGIAFAMRKLPWESTTQASLTLSLVNPFLWYLVDRTQTGFWLSTLVGLTGMGIILGLHPEIVPPATGVMVHGRQLEYDVLGGLSKEAIAVGTWLASVLFSACVCFGNIGRQLAPGRQEATF